MASKPILVISGTNRPGANALRVRRIIEGLYAKAHEPIDVYGLEELPKELLDPSAYAQKPAAFVEVQQRIVEAKGLHIVTPEYNGSMPGILKYFIDMLKFPESFQHKPVAFVGEAAGLWGGLRPVEQLQQIFGYRNAFVYPERVFIPQVNNRFDASGNFNDAAIVEKLEAQVRGFIRFANALDGFGEA